MIIRALSVIWKSGGVIERDKSDGRLILKNHQNVPPVVLKTADAIFDDIDKYLKSVEGMNKVDSTIWKMIVYFCGWQKNEVIGNFLNSDEVALNLFVDYQTELAKNGWNDIYTDYREYENERSAQLKNEIFKQVVAFGKGAK